MASDERMREEKIWRLIKDLKGGEWLWLKTRPSNHWAWRLCQGLGEEHLMAFPRILRELAGFRGFPSRRILRYFGLKDELVNNFKFYENMSVEEIVEALDKNIALRVTPKYVYDLAKKFGLKVGRK
jgi:hypothetical protein